MGVSPFLPPAAFACYSTILPSLHRSILLSLPPSISPSFSSSLSLFPIILSPSSLFSSSPHLEYFYGTLCTYLFSWDYGHFQDNNNRTFKDIIVSRGQGYHQMFILIPYMHSAHQYEQNEVSHNHIDLF